MNCPQCGRANLEGSRFCQWCGAGLVMPVGPAGAAPVAVSAPARGVPWGWILAVAAVFIVFGGVLLAVVGFVVVRSGALTPRPALSEPVQPIPTGLPVPTLPAVQPMPAQPTQGVQPAPVPGATQRPQTALTPGAPPGATPSPAASGGAGQVRMVPYSDPSMQFSILSPEGWQVRQDGQSGTTIFYEDTPDGISFTVMPGGYIPRAINGERFIQVLLQALREDFPDARITRQRVSPFGPQVGPPDLTEQGRASFTWTDLRGLRWQGELSFILGSNVLTQVTIVSGSHYQGPTNQWGRLEPIFNQMLSSLR